MLSFLPLVLSTAPIAEKPAPQPAGEVVALVWGGGKSKPLLAFCRQGIILGPLAQGFSAPSCLRSARLSSKCQFAAIRPFFTV